MQRWKGRLLFLAAAALIVGTAYVALNFVFLDFVVDLWWFRALKLETYFWMRLLYRYAIFAGTVTVFFAIFFFNFWLASRYLGARRKALSGENKTKARAYRELLTMFRTASLKIYAPLSFILSIPIAGPLFEKWESTLLYLFAPPAGVMDPHYHKDVSFYLFSFPIYELLQRRFLIVSAALFAATLILYLLERRVLAKEDLHLPLGAKIHLTLLVVSTVAIQAWGYMLQRYGLLYTDSHQPLFFGPGFTEMQVILPLIWVTLGLLVATAMSVIVYIHARRGLVVCLALAGAFAAAHLLRQSDFLPAMVQKYIVKPNESSRERPYLENSVRATLAAYNLGQVKIREFDVERLPWTAATPSFHENIRNIPVWDRELLDDVYEQLQGIRTYYDFQGIDVDRYTVRGLYQQVYMSVRELNLDKLPEHSKSWINTRLQYTHGYGVVMTPAAQGGDEIMTWFIQDIPPRSDYGLEVKTPGIYYGLGDSEYVVAPNEAGEMDYPKGEATVTTSYKGEGGIALSSIFRKLLFAVYLRDRNLFFTTKINKQSRILIRRNITERIQKITPFLRLDGDPYVVITGKGTFWINDAYTASGKYPNAAPYEEGGNYIRNSVKVVVDAYNGTVAYYLADAADPVVQAYKRMYPGLLQDLDEMDGELKAHIRYPREIFKIQMSMYAKYHQQDPEVFYRDEDLWELAGVYRKEDTVGMEPYYVTLDLIERGRPEFLLLCPMSPRGRDNLRALCVVGCDGEHYGEVTVYSFPKGTQVYGPSQINALIDQDTRIAEQFTLWNQVGSEVKRGRMIILPIGKVVFYIQPVYLRAAARLKIPELKRLIVSQGDTVVMDKSLEEAFAKLEEEIKNQIERQERRFEQLGGEAQTGEEAKPQEQTPPATEAPKEGQPCPPPGKEEAPPAGEEEAPGQKALPFDEEIPAPEEEPVPPQPDGQDQEPGGPGGSDQEPGSPDKV